MNNAIEAVFLKVIVTEVFKQVCALTGYGYEKLEARITNACHKYDKNYRERHGQVKVFCAGMREPILLDDVYVAIQFLDQHTLSRYRSPEEVEKAFRERDRRHFGSSSDKRQDGIQVANDKQYLMVLGGPGVGKSTFLRKVGLEALNGKEGNFEHKRIPVFLELKKFEEDQIDIEALIAREFEICGYPYPEQMTEVALKLGKLLILFDGLDEVPDPNVGNVIHEIGDFVDQYSQNHFIASCRIAAYSGEFRRFTEVEMAAFNDTQIEAYIKKWFDSTPDQYQHQLDKEMKTSDRCWETLNASEHSATKELAKNPLLLTLLCMVYNRSQNFPRNRAALYERALSIFLEEWAAEKRVNRRASITQYLDIADEKWMLSEIAAKNFNDNRLFFSKDELIVQIQAFGAGNVNKPETFNARDILETILVDQGLFVERVRDSYSFSHLTFQEYLTANYIVGHPQSIPGLVTEYLHNHQWREVFLLTSGLMYKADDLLVAMEAEATKLINTDGLKSLFQWVKQKTDTTDDRYKGIVKRLFILRQFFSLWLLNKIYEVFENVVNHVPYFHFHFNFDRELDRDLAREINLDSKLAHNFDREIDFARVNLDSKLAHNLDREIDLAREINFDSKLARNLEYLARYLDREIDLTDLERELPFVLDLARYLDLDLDRNRKLPLDRELNFVFDLAFNLAFDLNLCLYQDFFKTMDTDFYRSASPQSKNQFDKQLQRQITFVNRIEDVKIFKQVDLQRMVQRFNEQREIIKAAVEGKSVEPPAESIHDTWLSVLGITDEMLAIPREALAAYATYLEAVEFIIACKEAAGRVSPDTWQQIEDRFLTVDAANIKN